MYSVKQTIQQRDCKERVRTVADTQGEDHCVNVKLCERGSLGAIIPAEVGWEWEGAV